MEAVDVSRGLEADQVGAEHALHDLAKRRPSAGLQVRARRLDIGEGDVEEETDAASEPALPQEVRDQGELVVVDPAPGSFALFGGGLGEGGVHGHVRAPVGSTGG